MCPNLAPFFDAVALTSRGTAKVTHQLNDGGSVITPETIFTIIVFAAIIALAIIGLKTILSK